jgi:hypothetical protein
MGMCIVTALITQLHPRSCLFYSVHGAAKDAGLLDVPRPQDLRFMTANFMSNHPEHPAVKHCGGGRGAVANLEINSTDTSGVATKIIETPEAYCARLRLRDTFGGDLEVQILAILLEVDILVYSVRSTRDGVLSVHGDGEDDIFRGNTQGTLKQPLRVLRIMLSGSYKPMQEVHYDAVVKKRQNRRASLRLQQT